MENYNIIDTIEYKSYKIEIGYDEYCESPMDEQDLIQLFSFYRYLDTKNDTDLDPRDYDSIEDFEKALGKETVYKRLYLYNHSGIRVSTSPFSCKWDSGLAGFLFIPKENVIKEFGKKLLTQKVRKKAEKYIESFVEVLDDYYQGDVYYYKIYDKDDKLVDYCYGIYGENNVKEDAKDTVDYIVNNNNNK